MVTLSDLQWIQGYFSTLVGLFDRVVLNTNIRKAVGMVFHPCQAAGTHLEAAYGRRMAGAGTSYQERKRGRVLCKECREEMDLGSMAGHTHTQNGMSEEGRRSWEATSPGGEPRTYSMAFPTSGVTAELSH